jgi:hypothetical protein
MEYTVAWQTVSRKEARRMVKRRKGQHGIYHGNISPEERHAGQIREK